MNQYYRMKLTYLILICIMGSTNSIFAQNYIKYHNLVNEAKYWMYKQEYKKAEQLYKKAFHIEKPMGKDSYLLARCYAFQNKKKQCYKWLKNMVSIPISFSHYTVKKVGQRELFETIFNKEGEFESLILELKNIKTKISEKYKDSTYHMLQDSMAALYIQDQLYRKNATQEELNSDMYLNLLHQNDLYVQQKLLDLIKKYGYPGYPKIGTDNGNLILVHILGDNEMHNVYKELLYEELQKGNILPFGYAYMMDRWNLVTNNICYLSMRIYTKKLCTENDYEEIAKRRLEIGLSIYFTGQSRKVNSYNLHPWVNDEFVKKHSLLNKKCR